MRDRVLLIASAVLVVVGVVSAVLEAGGDHVGPAGCAKRVARVLHLDLQSEVSVSEDTTGWTASAPTGRLILRVAGEGHRVTSVEALAGPGADVLERRERLVGLAVRC